MGCSGQAPELPQGDPGGFVTGSGRGSGDSLAEWEGAVLPAIWRPAVMAWVPGRPN